jgi:tight adherence protein B
MALLILVLLLIFGSGTLLFIALYPAFVGLVEKWHRRRIEKITPKLDQVWISLPHNKLIIVNIFLPLLLGITGMVLAKSPVGGAIGLAIGMLIPYVILKQIERRRKNKFASQLVDAAMIISSSLKAGLSLLQSLEALVEEMPAPTSQEFGLVLREHKMGVTLEASLEALNKRINIEELELLVDAILIARETGGDLPRVLSRLVTTIRDRRKLKESIKTLTLQGRMQGLIMSALPILFAWWVLGVNKHHFDIMLQTDQGRFLLILAVVLQVVGMFFIRKFSTLKI